jgi:hypothetical protein
VDPEQERIERDIMRQRMKLGDDVDALADKVSPSQAARRQVGRLSNAATTVKDRVMGQAAELTHSTHDHAADAGHGLADSASSAKDSVLSAKDSTADAFSSSAQAAKRKTEGNPLAAGLIAFGVGWLASSLIPASPAEQRAGGALREKAEEPLRAAGQQLGDKAKEIGEHLREPATDAAESVKQSALDAAQEVKDTASGHAERLSDEATDHAHTVQETAQNQ